MNTTFPISETVVVGGGAAGLSAALILGRCRRKVDLIDWPRERKGGQESSDFFRPHDVAMPTDLIRNLRAQLSEYPAVRMRKGRVVDIVRTAPGFEIQMESGEKTKALAVLLASGVEDVLPELPGIGNYFGSSIHRCPYRHAWEHRDSPVGVYGQSRNAVDLAIKLTSWSSAVTLYGEGDELTPSVQSILRDAGVNIARKRVIGLEGDPPYLRAVVLEDGLRQVCRALFLADSCHRVSDLVVKLGGFSGDTRAFNSQIGCQGVFIAGRAALGPELPVIAAADGLRIGKKINEWLLQANRSYLAGGRSSHAATQKEWGEGYDQ